MNENRQIVVSGNNLDTLKNYPDNYFDSVVTDPPYGLGKEPNTHEMLKAWIETGYLEVKGSGFMGKEWDAFVPQPLFWKEIFRVLKHGGHIVAFFGTRTYDWGCMAIRLAGFEIRDCIQWVYGCLSDDTEILTKNGYIPYHKFKDLPNFGEQEILIYDIENDIYKWEKPERWNDYSINKDTCYRIKSNSTDQIVSRNHRCLVEREGKLVFIQAELLSEMEYMPTLSDDFFELQKTKVLQSSMQRILSGSRMEEMGQNRFRNSQFTTQQNEKRKQRREKPCVEGWNNLSKKERILFGCEIEICEMPERIYSNGEERWLCGGISVNNGKSDMQTFVKNRVCSSYRPQSNEQQHKQPNAICNEQGTQAIRVGRSYSTTLATITPFEYTGVIFCPTVSTGCFVARRNGKIFITGNSGFPKSHNISKAINKMNGVEFDEIPASGVGFMKPDSDDWNVTKNQLVQKGESSEDAKKWEGWGSALKPANEPIVLARKPLEKGLSIAENVLKWGTGAINIDASRIGSELIKGQKAGQGFNNVKGFVVNTKLGNEEAKEYISEDINGRFPANFIMTHHPDCECIGINKEEIVEDWICHDDCPIKILDEQSGERKSNGLYKKDGDWENKGDGQIRTWNVGYDKLNKYAGEIGGASRFFYIAKASKWERNYGLDEFEEKQTIGGGGLTAETRSDGSLETSSAGGKFGSIKAKRQNIHPTVKPIKLMQYLVRMITPPNGIVLDPFAGSGTTGIACKIDDFQFVGLELSVEYTEIANARIQSFDSEKVFIDETKIFKNKSQNDNDEDENNNGWVQLELF